MKLIGNSQEKKQGFNVRIRIRLAEPYWRHVGARELELDFPNGACVSDLMARLRADYPALALEMGQSPPHVFIEDVEASSTSFLTESGRVHLVWPVAGG